uniref:Uncharacterized protein n=1 Tax=Scleropages formosus TaxID=113540 RepID=A0A8C9W0M6_SCLFO
MVSTVKGGTVDTAGVQSSLEDESLQFLTCEERESILFLEQTIDSLEQELEDEDLRSTDPSLKEQDIIDLVQAEPDPARPRGVSFDPISPGTGKLFFFHKCILGF